MEGCDMGKGKTAIYESNDEKWEIKCDLDAIARSCAVKADPARMKKVKAMAKDMLEESRRKKDEIQSMIDLGLEE
jgi:hypothetical protein